MEEITETSGLDLLFVVVGVYEAFGYVLAWGIGIPFALGIGAVFVLLSSGLARLERPLPQGIFDHLRHCAMLYAGLVLLVSFLVPELVGPWCCTLQWSLGAILFLVVVYAVKLDAATIYVARRRATSLYHSPDLTAEA